MHIRIINSHLSLDYLNKYGNGKTFIETGTFLGDTIYLALEAKFEKIHSTELNDELYERAVKLFDHKPQVKIWHGDSVHTLKEIMKELNGPATFWLDAHASGPLPGGISGGSPVLDELEIIREHGNNEHTIFIDDRRLFGSVEWSEVQEESAMEIIRKINPSYNILLLDGEIEKDVICATIKSP